MSTTVPATDSIESTVNLYIQMRSAKKDKEDEVKEMEKELEALSFKILDYCNENKLDGFKTQFGTVSKRVQSRFWVSDWHAMYQFINDRQLPELLEKRISNTNMKQYLEENPEDVPEGLQSNNKYVISVRQSKNGG